MSKTSSTPRFILTALVAATLAACGGGGEAPRLSPQEFGAALTGDAPTTAAASDRLRIQAASGGTRLRALAVTTITNAQLFTWAQATYPELFGSGTPASFPLTFEGKQFDVRAYTTGNYLGVANGVAYGYGAFTGYQLVSFGAVSGYTDLVCNSGKVTCTDPGTGGGGTGTLNACTMPAAQALVAGNRLVATYTTTTTVNTQSETSEVTLEGVVNGAATFEGQSAIQTTSTFSTTVDGMAYNTRTLSFEQIGPNGMIRSLGNENEISSAALPTAMKSRLVFNPADLNTEFTLAEGTSLTKSVTTTTTTLQSPFPNPGPSTSTSTTRYTFEGRETITVNNRSYDTCRYRETDDSSTGYDLNWYIVGKGMAARMRSFDATGKQLSNTDLKSGTFNGAPL